MRYALKKKLIVLIFMESTALNIALLSKKSNTFCYLIFMESTALNIALLSKKVTNCVT